MKETITELLDDLSARLDCDVLDENEAEREVHEKLSDTRHRASTVTSEIKNLASAGDALLFATELTGFLDRAKAKALETKRIQDEIEVKQAQVAETHAEIQQLSASLPALAQAVNLALTNYEDLRYDHNAQEFQIATLATRLSMRRAELTDLRGQLQRLKEQEVQK